MKLKTSDTTNVTVWPQQPPQKAHLGAVLPLPSVHWRGVNYHDGDGSPTYSTVSLVGQTLIRNRGNLTYVEQFETLDEAYEASSKMIFLERMPYETVYIHDLTFEEDNSDSTEVE